MKDKNFISLFIIGVFLSVFVHFTWVSTAHSFFDNLILFATDMLVLFMPVVLLEVDRKYGL